MRRPTLKNTIQGKSNYDVNVDDIQITVTEEDDDVFEPEFTKNVAESPSNQLEFVKPT